MKDREAGLGLRFLREIRTTLNRVADNPLMFPLVDKEARRALLHKFPFSIYFLEDLDVVFSDRGAPSTPPTGHVEVAALISIHDSISLTLAIPTIPTEITTTCML